MSSRRHSRGAQYCGAWLSAWWAGIAPSCTAVSAACRGCRSPRSRRQSQSWWSPSSRCTWTARTSGPHCRRRRRSSRRPSVLSFSGCWSSSHGGLLTMSLIGGMHWIISWIYCVTSNLSKAYLGSGCMYFICTRVHIQLFPQNCKIKFDKACAVEIFMIPISNVCFWTYTNVAKTLQVLPFF